MLVSGRSADPLTAAVTAVVSVVEWPHAGLKETLEALRDDAIPLNQPKYRYNSDGKKSWHFQVITLS